MNIFGVGPLELLVVLVFALLVLGPEGMVKAGRILGRTLSKIYRSEFWQAMRGSGDLWQKLSRDLGITEDLEEMRAQLAQTRYSEVKRDVPSIREIERDLDQSPEERRGKDSGIDQGSGSAEELPDGDSNGNGKENGS